MPRASSPTRPRPPKPKPKQSPNAVDDVSAAVPAAVPAVPAAAAAIPAAVRVKNEPTDDKITIVVRPRAPVVLPNPAEPWNHPDELVYIRPYSWSQSALISHLLDNAFDVPPRLPPGSFDPWCLVTSRNGTTTIVPKGYRLPLMFAMKFQWESLRLVLTSQQREDEWKDYKFDFLHVSRLCAEFLKQAQEAMVNNGMDKAWRSPMFDRALTRYYRRWLVNREEFLMWFWKEFEEEEYKGDILKKDWTRFVLKGHKGFHLTKEECEEGLSYQSLTSGLEQRPDGRFHWVLPHSSHPPSDPGNEQEKKTVKITGKRKRGLNIRMRRGWKGKRGKETENEKQEKAKDVVMDQTKEAAGGVEEELMKGPIHDFFRDKSPSRADVAANNDAMSTPLEETAGVNEVEEKEEEKEKERGKEKEKEKKNPPLLSANANESESESESESENSALSGREVKEADANVNGKKMHEIKKPRVLLKSAGGKVLRLRLLGTAVAQKSPATSAVDPEVKDDTMSAPPAKRARVDGDEGTEGEDTEVVVAEKEKEKEKEKEDTRASPPPPPPPQVQDQNDKEPTQEERQAKNEQEHLRRFMEKWGGGENNAAVGGKEVEMSDEDIQVAREERKTLLIEAENDPSMSGDDKQEKKDGLAEDEDDMILQTEGLGYPEPQLIAMEVDVPAPRTQLDAVDKDETPRTSDIAPSAPAPPTSVSSAAVQTPTTIDSMMPSTSAGTARIILTSAQFAGAAAAATTSTNASNSTSTAANMQASAKSTASRPVVSVPTFTLPSDAPPPAQPSNPSSNPYFKLIASPSVRGRSTGSFHGASGGAGKSGSRGGSGKSMITPAATVEGANKDGPGEGGTSAEKRQSSWDARVSKALERAKAPKGSVPGQVSANVVGGAVSPRVAWYVPQVLQWDPKGRECVLPRTHAARPTGISRSPDIPTAARYPPTPALSSKSSASGSSSGSRSGSITVTTPTIQSQQSSLLPAIEPVAELAPAPAPSDVPSPQSPVSSLSAESTAAAVKTPTATKTATDSGTTEVSPPEASSELTTAPDPAPLITEANAPTDSPDPLLPARTFGLQPRPQSSPRPVSPAPTVSHDRIESQLETPRPEQHSNSRELPPLPGPPLAGRSTTFEEYQLTAAAWSGSGSSDPGNEHDGMREYSISERGHEHERDLQHNRANRQYEKGGYYDGHRRQSTTPSSPTSYRRYHPYVCPPPPSRLRYHSSLVPPYFPPTPYNEYPPYYPPSVSSPYRPSRRSSINGSSMSEPYSPVLPDIDPESAEVDGSPVATRIVSIVQDTMARLADVLSASGSMRESGSRSGRERSSVTSVSGSVSADAGTSRSGGAQRELGSEDCKLLKLEDVLGEIRSLKENHQREVNKMRSEIEGLRRQVQNLEGQSTRDRGTDETMDTIEVTVTNAVVAESSSSYPIDLTGDANDESSRVNGSNPLGNSHLAGTSTIIKARDSNSPSLPLRQDRVHRSEVDKGKRKETLVCPPRVGMTPPRDGIPMSPGHSGLPLPIKSQRKGRMFVPIDMADDDQ